MRRSSSDRVKVAVSMCAILSSTLTLAAYFGGIDYAVRKIVQVTSHPVAPLIPASFSDPTLFPPGLAEFTNVPTASS